jgi:diguanylate cyclase (GGDEF)-like protein
VPDARQKRPEATEDNGKGRRGFRGGQVMFRAQDGQPSLAWLFVLPPKTERTLRMEALIARLRLLVLILNSVLLLFFMDTTGWHMHAAWGLLGFAWLYALPIVVFQPYRRWRVFETSMLTALLDAAATAVFIVATGGAESPFFLLYYLISAAVAMRFDLRQAMLACMVYVFSYAVVYLYTWEPSADAFGELLMRCAYMLFISVGVGHLAREENSRSQQVDEIERLNAENQRLLSRKEKEARIDRLTGLLNRGSLEKDALRELRRAKSAGGSLRVLFCDMDRLKRINDELGHDAGDRVLRQVGTSLKRGLRSQDLIGRYGGDEFVVVLPSLTRETAYERADQLVEQIRGLNEGLPEQLQIGLSVGIATYPFDAQDYPTLVKLADQAMYLAKREGGSCVRTANDLRLFWEEVPRTA